MNISSLRANSYVPYSGTQACCVVESEGGHFFPGVRIENTVFPLTISELQSAVFGCLSEGEQPRTLYTEHPDDERLRFWEQEYGLLIRPLGDLQEVVFRAVALPDNNLEIENLLGKLLDNAITLNSDFPVSAVLETGHGLITGVNIECSEWSLGLCAERVALAKAISYGIEKYSALHVHTRYGEFSSPCGACRQVIVEHMPRNPVYLYHANGTHSMHYSSDMLPFSFRSSALKQPKA